MGVNKMNIMQMNLKNAETPRRPWVSDTCVKKTNKKKQTKQNKKQTNKKEPSLWKGDMRSHLSRTLQTEKIFFHPAVSKVAHLSAKSSGASHAGCVCYQNKQHKNIIGLDHTEFGLINHRRRWINYNTLFGRNDYSQIVQEDYWVAVRKSRQNNV